MLAGDDHAVPSAAASDSESSKLACPAPPHPPGLREGSGVGRSARARVRNLGTERWGWRVQRTLPWAKMRLRGDKVRGSFRPEALPLLWGAWSGSERCCSALGVACAQGRGQRGSSVRCPLACAHLPCAGGSICPVFIWLGQERDPLWLTRVRQPHTQVSLCPVCACCHQCHRQLLQCQASAFLG